MASKLEIRQYAVNYLAMYSSTSAVDLRAALRRQFLEEAPSDTTSSVANASVGGLSFGHPIGCLIGLMLAIPLAVWRWWNRVNVNQTLDDIDAVMANLEAEGRWTPTPRP